MSLYAQTPLSQRLIHAACTAAAAAAVADTTTDDDVAEGEDDEQLDEDNEDNEDNEEMPPKKLTPPAPATAKKAATTPAPDMAGLTTTMASARLSTCPPFLLSVRDVTISRHFIQEGVRYVEVDFQIPGVPIKDAVQVDLKGKVLRIKRGTPSFFFETKRLRKSMGKNFHPNDTKFVAHDAAVQVFRAQTTPIGGLVFPDDKDCQTVTLPFECTNPITMTIQQHRICDVNQVVAGVGGARDTTYSHAQFATTITCRMRTTEQGTVAKQRVSVDIQEGCVCKFGLGARRRRGDVVEQ